MDGAAPLWGDPIEAEPPNNVELEMALLGAVMVNRRALEESAEHVTPDDFYLPFHGEIWRVCLDLVDRGEEVRPVTVRQYVKDHPEFAEIGGTRYLGELAGGALNVIDAPAYAKSIADHALRRRAIEEYRAGSDALRKFDTDRSGREIVEEGIGHIDALLSGADKGEAVQVSNVVPIALKTIEAAANRTGLTGISTGLATLDELTGGLHAPDFIILAGRPGMGKSALGFNLGFKVAAAGHAVAAFSLEMGAEQVVQRELSARTGIPYDDFRKGRVPSNRWDDITRASAAISALPLFIDETPARSVAQIRGQARRLKRRHGLGLVIIDYLQLMRGSRQENRFQEVSEISRSLKGLAKELECPVLALSQLSRALEAREDKRPLLSDLRESGQLEQDADAVWFVYRHHYYLSRQKPSKKASNHEKMLWGDELRASANECEIIIGKQRHGPADTARVWCDMATNRFRDMSADEAEEAPF